MNMLMPDELDILKHTLAQNRPVFCGDSPAMQSLVGMGYMESLGKVGWCPDEYFTITADGRAAVKRQKVVSRG